MGLLVLSVSSVAAFSLTAATGQHSSSSDGTVLWEGGFDTGGVPHGANGPSCNTGAADGPDAAADQYSSVEEMGNTACTNAVSISTERVRTPDSTKSLKVLIAAHQQREQPSSKFVWTPDDHGSVDQWYGFSFYYGTDWGTPPSCTEISGTSWHDPMAFRMAGDNGSMNFSGDCINNEARMVLRRNSVKDQEGFYHDGLGIDRMDLGPVVSGRWMDFVCHIRWSTTATNALRECWRDGQYKGAKTSLNAVAANPHVLRMGDYQETNITHPRTMFVDNVRIGTSYAAVDPARSGDSPSPSPTPSSSRSPSPSPSPSPSGSPPPSGISFAGDTVGDSGSAAEETKTTLSVPSGTTAGSFLLAVVAVRGNPTLTPPPGWALVTRQSSPQNIWLYAYRMTCAGTCAGPWTWTKNTSNGIAGVLLAYRGVDALRPVDAFASEFGASSSQSASAPPVATSAGAERVVTLHAITGGVAFNEASGTTGRAQQADTDGVYRASLGAADFVQPLPGTTPTVVASFSTAGYSDGMTIALRAAG